MATQVPEMQQISREEWVEHLLKLSKAKNEMIFVQVRFPNGQARSTASQLTVDELAIHFRLPQAERKDGFDADIHIYFPKDESLEEFGICQVGEKVVLALDQPNGQLDVSNSLELLRRLESNPRIQ